MSIANLHHNEFKMTGKWLCLGDRAIAKSSIASVLINDGRSLTDKSIGITFCLDGTQDVHWNFKSADQLNAVLDEIGLKYTPTTETVG